MSADGFVEGKPHVHNVFGKKVTAEMERKTCGLLRKGVFSCWDDSRRKGGEALLGEVWSKGGPGRAGGVEGRMCWDGNSARPASTRTEGQEDTRLGG